MYVDLKSNLHNGRDLKDLLFANQVCDGGYSEHDFESSDTAARYAPAEHLRDDALERLAQHDADLTLSVRGKLVDDPIDRGGSRRRMQCTEDEVPGFGRFERDFDRLEVTHFADEHDVRVFTQGRAQRVPKGFGMGADFPLVHEAFLVFEYEFD